MLLSKSRRFMVWVLAMLMLAVTALPVMGQDLTVNVDGKKLEMDVAPVIKDGTTLVPIRQVAEAIGGVVSFEAASNTVIIKTTEKSVILPIGSKESKTNGLTKILEVPAQVVNGRTLVPLRFVAESLGAKVDYDASNKAVDISYFNDMKGTLKIGGSTTIQPLTQVAADKLMKQNTGLSVTIAGGGSGEGIKGAHNGTFNIGSVSRDLEAADQKSYPGLTSYQIGLDGIVIIVNSGNGVSNLTQDQVFDIFTGKIKNWKDVGGKDAAIFIETRETGSGTLTAFEELALHKKGKVVATATPNTSNGLIKQAVVQNANAIGFLSMGYVDGTIKAVKVDGVSPLKSKALSHEWPYVRNLNVVTKGKPTGLTAKFIDYLLSSEGQSIVSQDYLPLKAVD